MQRLKALLENKVNLFYVLAFIPLMLVSYFNVFGAIIPTFGFLLLFLKKDDLSFHLKTNLIGRVLGLFVIFISFFLRLREPMLIRIVFSLSIHFGGLNYIVYIVGLCLVFLGLSSFKHVFTPLFLMVAASLNRFMSEWLGVYLSPHVVPSITSLLAGILQALGIGVETPSPSVIVLQTWRGSLPVAIVWSCVGIDSILIFSIILVVFLFEDESNVKTKVLWSIVGIVGTVLLNIIRLTLIFITDYIYGFEAGGQFHYAVGYILFFAWLAFFFYAFSERQAIVERTRRTWQFMRGNP